MNFSETGEKALLEPYYWVPGYKTPRYYQRIAIDRTVNAVASGRDRVLLVCATGTGKTFMAFQIIYRLWKAGIKKKIVFLADRNVLVDQTISGDFKPFGGKMTKVENKQLDSSYEIYLALYQQLAGDDFMSKLLLRKLSLSRMARLRKKSHCQRLQRMKFLLKFLVAGNG